MLCAAPAHCQRLWQPIWMKLHELAAANLGSILCSHGRLCLWKCTLHAAIAARVLAGCVATPSLTWFCGGAHSHFQTDTDMERVDKELQIKKFEMEVAVTQRQLALSKLKELEILENTSHVSCFVVRPHVMCTHGGEYGMVW